jgi:glutathione S-transferase
MNGNSYHLFANPRSPFARRIRLALNRLQLPVSLEFVEVFKNPTNLNAANPIGAVPTLLTPDAGPLSDSSHILEYLHERSGQIWPNEGNFRVRVRQNSVLAVGVIQSAVLYYQEAHMHESPSPFWKAEHVSVIQETLSWIAASNPSEWMRNSLLTQAGWDLAVALEYVTFRLPFVEWEKRREGLVQILNLARLDGFFVETAPKL